MELTLNIPESLAAQLKERHGVGRSDLERIAVSFLSKLANEPQETPARGSDRAKILDDLTEKLSAAGVYDLPTAPVPNA